MTKRGLCHSNDKVLIPTIMVTVKNEKRKALVDTGSTLSVISSSLVDENDEIIEWDEGPITLMDGTSTSPQGYIRLKFKINNKRFKRNFVILNSDIPVVLGMDFLKSNKIGLDLGKLVWWFTKDEPIQLFPLDITSSCDHARVQKLTRLNELQTHMLNEVLAKFNTVIDAPLGTVKDFCHEIILTEEKPKRFAPYSATPLKQAEIDKQVNLMLEMGLIRPSNSPYASPILLRPKPNGEFRFCVNFKYINALTIDDSFPMKKITDILMSLANAKYLSKLDAEKGYWQVPMHPDSIKYTAFRTKKGLYEYLVCPFGLKNAPATYQRIINSVLEGLDDICVSYQDDILIFSKTFEEHLEHLEMVLNRLKDAGITILRNKCEFGKTQVKFLGHIVSTEGLMQDPSKLTAVEKFPTPKTKKAIRSFLGLCAWYSHFIPNFAEIAKPLYLICSVKKPFQWTEEENTAFVNLKQGLCSGDVLTHPHFDRPFFLSTDASNIGISGVLTQTDESGKEKVISYTSKTLSKSQQNYSTVEKELLAIIHCLNKFYEYLDSQNIIIRTDNQALTYLESMKNHSQKLMRWAWKIQEFSPKFIHVPGKLNVPADVLSRYPVEDPDEIEDMEESFMDPPLHQTRLAYTSHFNNEMIRKAQADDFDIIQMTIDKPNEFKNIRGLVYKIKNNQKRIVIPKSLYKLILQEFHDHPSAGHAGIRKTYMKMKERIYFPNMKQFTAEYIKTCHVCQRTKYDNQKPLGLMKSPQIVLPWHTLYMDLMGPYTRSKPGGYKYLFVIVDYFTKFVQLFTLKEATSQQLAKIIEKEIICRYGLPANIICDNAKNMSSKVLQKLCTEWKINLIHTPVYTPHVNFTERVNRTLKPMIRAYIQDEAHHTWATHIHLFQMAINSNVQESTKLSPAMAMFGREFALPFDNILQENNNTDVYNAPLTTDEMGESRIKIFKEINDFICDNLKLSQHRQKKHYDARHGDTKFQPGDLVLMKNMELSDAQKGITASLNPPFKKDVYTIQSCISESVFMLTDPQNKTIGPIHIQMLRKFHPREVSLPNTSSDTRNLDRDSLVSQDKNFIEVLDNTISNQNAPTSSHFSNSQISINTNNMQRDLARLDKNVSHVDQNSFNVHENNNSLCNDRSSNQYESSSHNKNNDNDSTSSVSSENNIITTSSINSPTTNVNAHALNDNNSHSIPSPNINEIVNNNTNGDADGVFRVSSPSPIPSSPILRRSKRVQPRWDYKALEKGKRIKKLEGDTL